MANTEPPPLFDDEDNKEFEDSEDLFSSAMEEKHEKTSTVVENGNMTANLNAQPESKEDKDDDLFEEALQDDEPDNDDDDVNQFTQDLPAEKEKSSTKPPEIVTSESVTARTVPAGTSASMSDISSKRTTKHEESEDRYSIEILLRDPKKMGDGMNAYMVYKIITKTTIPDFRNSEMEVYRRFSDFLGLHDKLVEKYQHQGIIIPQAPEKSVIGMTKIKMSKEESGSTEFVERRRASLERFLNRIGKHPLLRSDPSFVDFLEVEGDLPRATSTSALSGAGMMRLFTKVGDSLGKIAYKMDETDQWFEEKQQQIELLDAQLRKLHGSVEDLVTDRKELAQSTGLLAKSISILGSVEEHTSLSRALSQLTDVEEKIDLLHMDEADNDFYVLAELLKDYLGLIQSIKDIFHERVKVHKQWKDDEAMLAKKRESKVKLELQQKMDKVATVNQEISEWEHKVEKSQEEFESISKTITKEIEQFERQRCRDFRAMTIAYLESLMNNQQQLIKFWETFLPEANAIA